MAVCRPEKFIHFMVSDNYLETIDVVGARIYPNWICIANRVQNRAWKIRIQYLCAMQNHQLFNIDKIFPFTLTIRSTQLTGHKSKWPSSTSPHRNATDDGKDQT